MTNIFLIVTLCVFILESKTFLTLESVPIN